MCAAGQSCEGPAAPGESDLNSPPREAFLIRLLVDGTAISSVRFALKVVFLCSAHADIHVPPM